MHKSTKLFLLLLAASVALLITLPASAATKGTHKVSASVTNISVWTEFSTGVQLTGFTNAISLWNKNNPSIQVHHRPVPQDNSKFVVWRTAMASNHPPDVLQWEGGVQTGIWAKAGLLTDLTSWWNAHKSEFALPAADLAACQYQGHMYCIPMLYEGVNEVFYNSNLLTKYNIPIPHTWNQLLSSLAAAKKDGLIPMAFGDKDGFPGEHMWMWLLATTCGAAKVNAAINTTTTKFTDPCFVEAAARIQQLQNDGYFSPGPAGVAYATAQAVFASGKAAFYQTGNWYLGTPPTTFKLGVIAPAPGVSPSESEGSIIQVFGIPSKGSNKAAAAKFLDFLFTPAFGVPWVHTTQQWDVADNVIDKGGAALAKQTFDQGYKNTKSSIPFLELALPIPIGEQQIYKGVQDLLTGQMTPQAFTASVQTALDKARAKATK